MSRNLTRKKNDYCKQNRFLSSQNKRGRDLLYSRLLHVMHSFNYLDKKDKLFILGIVRKKVDENE